MPSKEWRQKNPEKQKSLAKTARARRWARIKDDPILKAKANARVRDWYKVPENRAKQLARQKEKWFGNPEVRRRKQCLNLRSLYGITLKQKEELIASQGDKCAICNGSELQDGKWHLDHDHKTGKVRGALCMLCNMLLGKAKDDPAILRSAANYLEISSGNGVSRIIKR